MAIEQEKLNPTFYDSKGRIRREFKKFNWGACIFGPIWGIFNKSYWTFLVLIAFIPTAPTILLGLVLPIWFGYEGNVWAIKNKKWRSIEHFNHVQKLWAIWALIITLVILIPIILGYAFLITWIVNNPDKANEIIMKFGSMPIDGF